MEKSGRMQGNTRGDKSRFLWEGIVLALLLVLFGFLSYKAFHAAMLLLALCAWRMSRFIGAPAEAKHFFGLVMPRRYAVIWMLAGLGSGVIAWIFFFRFPGYNIPFPGIGFFALTAFAIGLVEELTYRGALYSLWEGQGVVWAIALSAVAHTGYKLALLAPHPSVDLLAVALWTLVAGAVLGLLRYFSGSTLPAAINHIAFDVLVYGGGHTGPDWVW
jgi:membrane protease YdiL (CAAX protease family)